LDPTQSFSPPRPHATPLLALMPENHPSDPLLSSVSYHTVGVIARGSSGLVLLATHVLTSTQVAVKVLPAGRALDKYLQTEVLNHRLLRHPHIIEFKEVFLCGSNICIAMEYASGGNLRSLINQVGQLQEPAARWFFQQMIVAVDYCHRRGVVNRDLKLENTLLQWIPGLPLPLLKLCDFGYSKANNQSAPKTTVGTLAYMAPEVVTSSQQHAYNGALVDVWSCGVALYVMLFGHYPFNSPDDNLHEAGSIRRMVERITRLQWAVPSDAGISGECRDLLLRMLTPAQFRISMQEIQQHSWFARDLIPGATTMNEELLSEDHVHGNAVSQSMAAVQEVFARAAARNEDHLAGGSGQM
jgi:serine/threonine-protein kinase SRK2